ncbi:MAG: response regulator [bacterium]
MSGAKEQKVLVVDDDPDITMTLGIYLEGKGYRAASAANGQEALDAVRRQRVDLVLLDLMMPVLDGFETLKRLQGDPATAAIPVFAISGKYLDAEMHARMMGESNVKAYFMKPLLLSNLGQRVAQVLG